MLRLLGRFAFVVVDRFVVVVVVCLCVCLSLSEYLKMHSFFQFLLCICSHCGREHPVGRERKAFERQLFIISGHWRHWHQQCQRRVMQGDGKVVRAPSPAAIIAGVVSAAPAFQGQLLATLHRATPSLSSTLSGSAARKTNQSKSINSRSSPGSTPKAQHLCNCQPTYTGGQDARGSQWSAE